MYNTRPPTGRDECMAILRNTKLESIAMAEWYLRNALQKSVRQNGKPRNKIRRCKTHRKHSL